jgi:hypothetical protein
VPLLGPDLIDLRRTVEIKKIAAQPEPQAQSEEA